MRFFIIDGFRGFFLLFMGIIHINGVTHVTIGKLNHQYFGWVEDAQGFVFISGLVVGLVYGGALLKRGSTAATRALWRRLRTIYSHQAFLILLFLTMAIAFQTAGATPRVLAGYTAEPVAFPLASLLLVSGSLHMGIFPMYIWFMMITPFVLVAIHNDRTPALILLSLGFWVFAQFGIIKEISLWIKLTIEGLGPSIRIGIFFNIFAWQIIFFSGLWAGFQLVAGKLDLSFLCRPAFREAFFLGLAMVIALGIFDRIVFFDSIYPAFSERFLSRSDRGNFSLIYLFSFYLDLFLVVWLLVAGPSCGARWVEMLSQFFNWLFTRRFLVFLGQHSLHVFSFHILLVYMLEILLEGRNISELTGSLILVAGTASLYLPAYFHARMMRKAKAHPRAKGTP